MKQEFWEFKFATEVSIRYHDGRRGTMQTMIRIARSVTVIGAMLTIVAATNPMSWSSPYINTTVTALALLVAADVPVVAPSANLTGKPAPSTAQEVLRDLQDKIDFVIDAGPTAIGVSSTGVDCSGEVPRIFREGARLEEIRRALLE